MVDDEGIQQIEADGRNDEQIYGSNVRRVVPQKRSPEQGEFGVADVLARAKVTSVDGLSEAGIAESGRGKVRLLKPDQLDPKWDPTNAETTVWQIVHHLIRVLEAEGEGAAAELLARIGPRAEVARELAYRLYTICERKKRAQEALSYNGLVQSWPEISRLAREAPKVEAEAAEPTLL